MDRFNDSFFEVSCKNALLNSLLLLYLFFIYLWVYSSQGLKAKKLKSKLEWLLVRNVVDHESVMQKDRIISFCCLFLFSCCKP